MKKLILGILLGFIINSGLRTYYSYLWWSAEQIPTNEQINISWKKNGYPKIIHDTIGFQDNLKYILITGTYTFRRWEGQFP